MTSGKAVLTMSKCKMGSTNVTSWGSRSCTRTTRVSTSKLGFQIDLNRYDKI